MDASETITLGAFAGLFVRNLSRIHAALTLTQMLGELGATNH